MVCSPSESGEASFAAGLRGDGSAKVIAACSRATRWAEAKQVSDWSESKGLRQMRFGMYSFSEPGFALVLGTE